MSQANKPKSINLIPKYFCDNQYFWCEREFQLRIFKTIKERQPILFWCKISHCFALKIFAKITLTLETDADKNYSINLLALTCWTSPGNFLNFQPAHWGLSWCWCFLKQHVRAHQRAHNMCVWEKAGIKGRNSWNGMEKSIFSFNKLLL